MFMIIEKSKFRDVQEEIKSLYESHFEELGGSEGACELDLNDEMIDQLEDRHCNYIARDDQRNVIGYLGIIISESLFNKNVVIAHMYMFYVIPEYRKSISAVAYRLITYVENDLAHRCNRLEFSISPNYDFSSFLEKLGYSKSQITYGKRL